ncbi:hypothetical protein JW960_00475 [candidate division KSB1 bacterium]|nr:hypothetical protein [candidate division KSB1 bacterium]
MTFFLSCKVKLFFSISCLILLLSSCIVKNNCLSGHHQSLKYALPSEPVSLDPVESNDLVYNQIVFNIFETLIKYDWEADEFYPMLATSWQVDTNQVDWTFKLRPHVTFHDGSPLNALAVKISFERQISPDSPYFTKNRTDSYGKFALHMIDNISIVDELTVRFHLKFACSYFLDNIASPYFSSIISPVALKKYGPKFGHHPVGTGPFTFSKWEKGEEILLRKYSHYWKKSQGINRIDFLILANLENRIDMLKEKKLDIITGLSASCINDLYYTPEIKVLTPQIIGTNFLGFNCKAKPFDSRDIREAVCFALDVKTMITSLSRGFATVANGPIPPQICNTDSLQKQQCYNIERARQFMRAAGYANGIDATLGYFVQTDTLRADPISQYIKSQLGKIGINLKIVPYNNWKRYEQEILVQGKTNMFIDGWPVFTKHADNFLYNLFHSHSNFNFFKYNNSDVDSLLTSANKITNNLDRQKIYQHIQQIIIDDTPAIFLSHPTMGYAMQARVRNFKIDPAMVVNLEDVDRLGD